MNDIIVKKLKKYVLFMSTIFFIATSIHLVYLYLYDGAEAKAQTGGSISEAIIGTFPHLNPLVISTDHNQYINQLLYRSVLKYNPNTQGFEADLMSCKLENLSSVECILENNLLWSDGTEITVEDIAATYNIIKETKVNPIIASQLENTKIQVGERSITFISEKSDISFIQLLLQPIIPKKITETLDSETVDGNFPETNGIYSGYFVIHSVNIDESLGITKITLARNEKYFKNPLYIEYLIFNLFRDEAHLLKNKNSFHIFHDTNRILGENMPRLNLHEYYSSQFVASFFNTSRLAPELRKYIAQGIDRNELIQELGSSKVKSVLNPFFSDTVLDIPFEGDMNSFFEKKGYFSKKELLKSVIAQEESQKSQEASPLPEKTSETGSTVSEQKVGKTQTQLKFIVSPSTQKYNFTSEDNILIEGKVDEGVSAVYINEYKLNGFDAGDTSFFYRLIESYDSIKEGENVYKIYYEKNGEKKFMEEFVYVYYSDAEKLKNIESTYFQNEPQAKAPEIQKELSVQKIDAKVSDIKLSSDAISQLPDDFFYNAKGEAFSISLVYPLEDPQIKQTADILQKMLEKKGIKVISTALGLGDITLGIRNATLSYDILLIGINLGIFDSNLFPYFHSSQVSNGYNFSNFKKLGLDILLEEINSKLLSGEEKKEKEEKILSLLKEENILKVLYTPMLSLYVDKNIKNFSLNEYLSERSARLYSLLPAYLSEEKTLKLEEKSLFGFFGYIFKKLF